MYYAAYYLFTPPILFAMVASGLSASSLVIFILLTNFYHPAIGRLFAIALYYST